MKICLIILALLVSGCASSTNDSLLKSIKPETALKAVQRFRAEPLGDNAMGYLSVIANFAENSEEVFVLVDDEYFPTEYKSMKKEFRPRLLGAYVAGNIEDQIVNNVRENRVLSGVKLMLYTYESMKRAGQLQALQEFETWIAKDKNGRLKFK